MSKQVIGLMLLGIGSLSAQNIQIALTERGTDAEFTKTMMVSNVFEFRGDSVANPLDFASAKVSDVALWRKVKAPAMNKTFRKGFSTVSSFGFSNY